MKSLTKQQHFVVMAKRKSEHRAMNSTTANVPSSSDVPVQDGSTENEPSGFDLDEALESYTKQEAYYGTDLVAVMQNLERLIVQEEVPLEKLRHGLEQANAIIIGNPALATDIMLPEHLAPLVKASVKLANAKWAAQGKRATKAVVDLDGNTLVEAKPARKPSKKAAEEAKMADFKAKLRARVLAQQAQLTTVVTTTTTQIKTIEAEEDEL